MAMETPPWILESDKPRKWAIRAENGCEHSWLYGPFVHKQNAYDHIKVMIEDDKKQAPDGSIVIWGVDNASLYYNDELIKSYTLMVMLQPINIPDYEGLVMRFRDTFLRAQQTLLDANADLWLNQCRIPINPCAESPAISAHIQARYQRSDQSDEEEDE